MFVKKMQGCFFGEIPTRLILPKPSGAREHYPENELARLTQSIARYGLLQPIGVRAIKEKGERTVYELVFGQMRLRACKLLCMQSVPCVIFECAEGEAVCRSIVENIIRCSPNMFELADCIGSLGSVGSDKISDRLGVCKSYIEDKLKLLAFTPKERELLTFAGTSEKKAISLLKLDTPAERIAALKTIDEAEQTVEYINSTEDGVKKVKAYIRDAKLFENTLEKAVELFRSGGGDVSLEKRTAADGATVFTVKIR